MGVDNPSGTGKGPETVDKPTTQGSGDNPPAESNGSSGRTPRADSLRRAGWNLEGYGETGTEQRDDRDQQTGTSSTIGSTGDQRRGPGDPPTEADPKAESDPETGTGEGTNTGGRDQDPRTTDTRQSSPQTGTGETDISKARDNGRQPEDPAGRTEPTADQPKSGVPQNEPVGETAGRIGASNGQQDGKTIDPPTENTGGTAETTDKAEPQQESGVPPADDPASAGRPPATRTEALRAKGWQFPGLPDYGQENAEAGSLAEAGDMGQGVGAAGKDEHGPTSGEGGQEAGRPQDQEHRPLHRHDTAPPETAQTAAEQPADPPQNSPETEQTASPDHMTDGPPPADDQPQGEDEGTRTNPEVPQSAEPAADTGNGVLEGETGGDAPAAGRPDHTTEPHTQPQDQEPRTGSTAPDTETGDAPDTGDTSPPLENTEHEDGTQEPHGEHDGDRGKKAENDDGTEPIPDKPDETKPDARTNPILSDVYTDGPGQVRIEPRYGREEAHEPGDELARTEPETADPASTRPREDPLRAEVGTRGRGEFGSPEHDPADDDPRQEDPERPRDPKDVRREMLRATPELQDAVTETAKPAFKQLDTRPPRTQPCTVRNISDHINSVEQPVKAGDAFVGAVSGVVVAVEVVRGSVALLKRNMGRRHASHG